MIRTLQILIIAIPIALFGWLLHQELVPSGEFRVVCDIPCRSPFIDQILPDQRVERDIDGVRIIDDPAFFHVHPHRHFDEVEAQVLLHSSAQIVELGGLARSGNPEIYDLKPLYNRIIEESEWDRLEENGHVLLQRNRVYESIGEFHANPPAREQVATYHATLEHPFRLPFYQPRNSLTVIHDSLVGFHEWKTYIKDEPLRVQMSVTDTNPDEGNPPALLVFNELGERVGGAVWEGGVFELEIPDLPEGVYKIELRADNDTIVRDIVTPQRYITFLNHLRIGTDLGIDLVTNASRVSLQPQSAFGVQTVNGVELNQALVSTNVDVSGGVLHLDRGEVTIDTNGYLAFNPHNAFAPDPVRLTPQTNLDDVDFIFARYTPAESRASGWKEGTALFDTSVLEQTDGSWKFAFSVPMMNTDSESVRIDRIDLTFRRKPFELADLWEFLR